VKLARRQSEFLEALAAHAAVDEPGLEAYRRNIHANWRNALAAAHPVCERLVGSAFFDECAARHARAAPSRDGDLNRFGASFASFLAGYPPAAGLPYLPDVARLEWAVHVAAFAADPEPFDAARLASMAVDDLGAVRWMAQAGSALIDSPHPVVSIWEANQPGGDGTLSRAWQPETAVVLRDGFAVRVLRAGRDAGLLHRLLEGQPMEHAVHDAEDAAALPRWVATGLFRGITC
jgi:hypothetical protein